LFHARNVEDFAQIIHFAREEGKRIRAVATGHSWSALVPTDEILVDVQRLNHVELEVRDPDRPCVVMGCGATVQDVNDLLEGAGYALPFNVVLESVRYGGLIATGSHGSGWGNQTLSDLVEWIEIVDAHGNLRRFQAGIDNPEVMNAVRLNLGLFGLIYRMALRVQKSWVVRAQDRRLRIPDVLEQLPELVAAHDNLDLFWWPFADEFWVKSWNRVEGQPLTARPRYDRLDRLRSAMDTRFYQQILNTLYHFPPLTPRVCPLTFEFAPTRRDQIVNIVEAIHYRRSIEVTRMGCVEVAFKLDRDFANVRAAIKMAFDLTRAYAAQGQYPFNVTLNVRFIHNSQCWLSPAFGEGHTCFIEVLSRSRQADWERFSGELAAQWLSLDRAFPHWAKEYRHIPGVVDHLRRKMGPNLERFNRVKAQANVDPDQMFMNPTLREIFV
jgi:hypothetical protein